MLFRIVARCAPLLFAFVLVSPVLAASPARPEAGSRVTAPRPPAETAPPEIIADPTLLPAPTARMRARILEAAKSGSLERVVTVLQSIELMPIFSSSKEKDPLAVWLAAFADSEGRELLAILIEALEAPAAHVDRGTAQEMFVWPYFARVPLRQLDAEETVALLRIVRGPAVRAALAEGVYRFWRVGIAPDGVWHFFVAGN